jgi:hypothetical protein
MSLAATERPTSFGAPRCSRNPPGPANLLPLGAQLRAAAESAGEDYEARLRAVGLAYVRFAISDEQAGVLLLDRSAD